MPPWHTGFMDTNDLTRSSISAHWNSVEQAVELVVDGRSVVQTVDPQGMWGVSPFARRFRRGAARGWLVEYLGAFSQRDDRLLGDELEIAVCGACGDPGCGNLAVDLTLGVDTVVWSRPHWAGDAGEDDDEAAPDDPESLLPSVLVFDRGEYEAALTTVGSFIDRRGWYRPWGTGSRPERLLDRFNRVWDD